MVEEFWGSDRGLELGWKLKFSRKTSGFSV